MPSVLIRDVPGDDLDQIRAAAAERGTSLQSYLREAVCSQAAYLRRQAALATTAERMRVRPVVPADEGRAVLHAIEQAHAERADQLRGEPAP